MGLASPSAARDLDGLSLTDHERQWLAEHPNIRLGDDFMWPPFAFVDDKGVYSGISSGYMDWIARSLQTEIRPVLGLTWAQVVDRVKAHEIDLLPAVVRSKEREAYLNFTKPYITFPVVIATNRDNGIVSDLESLAGRRVGVVKGYITNELLAKDYPAINLVPFDSLEAGLTELDGQRVDAVVDNLAAIIYESRRLRLAHIKIGEATPYRFELCMATRKDWPELAAILDKSLEAISTREKTAIENTWLAVEVNFGLDLKMVLLWAVPSGLATAAVLVVILVWNRRLNREVVIRKRSEAALLESQQIAAALMNASADAALLLDADGIVRAANQALARRFARSVDDLVGAQFFDLLPAGLAATRRTACDEVIATGKPQCIKDERAGLVLENMIYPVFGAEGGVTRVAIYSRDITEQYHAEQAIRQVQEQYRLLFTDSPDAYLIMEVADGRISDCNRATEALLRVDRDRIVGLTPDALSPPLQPDGRPSRDAVAERIAETVEKGYHRFEWLHRRPDGSDFWAEVAIAPGTYQARDVLLVSWRDISDRKQAEHELSAVRDHLAKSNAELEQFAYVASHDLRQPLRMITSYLGLIERRLAGQLTGEIKDFLGFAVGGAKRMDALIVGLLEYSRTGKSAQMAPLALAEAVAEALGNLALAIQDAGGTVRVASDLPTVRGDWIEMVRLFQNLISNALKYHLPDQVPEVEIGCRRQGAEWVISVRDNGIGIAPEDHDRVFGIFQRLVTRDAYEGTGIGLAVCKKIVDHHRGRIWIESGAGAGTTFLVALPAFD
ncbi:MAG: ATP-binding protein [Actinomycetota bacterium]